MPLFEALILVASIVVLVIATQSRHLHPFLALVVVATAFGLACGFSISQIGKTFGNGVGQAAYAPGLVIVAAALVSGIAESAGACASVWRWLRGHWTAACVGLIAGAGASPSAAFATVTPLLPPAGDDGGGKARASTIALALALSASHGLFVFSPVPIAAVAILDASWSRVALFGVPLALLLAAFGAAWSRWSRDEAELVPPTAAPAKIPAAQRAGPALVLLLAIAVPIALQIVQSIGDIPSEPLGGGTSRELVIGVGRPLILLLVGVGIMVIGQWRPSAELLTDSDWVGRILGNVAGIFLIVGAALGLQRLCQETGMAELIGERLLALPVGAAGAVLVPFLAAAAIKTLQGSSLVAAITAAGMVQPILVPLGLADGNGKAFAALAIGAGAMTVAHVNDEYFWLVANAARLSPLRGLRNFTVGALLQGLIAIAALAATSALMSRL
jgi:GntP family gluconate:H+ symporter